MNTAAKRLAENLHAAIYELQATRMEGSNSKTLVGQLANLEQDAVALQPGAGEPWMDKVGHHLSLAVAAVPESVLRAWLLDPRVVGGQEIYRTLRAGCTARATDKPAAPVPPSDS